MPTAEQTMKNKEEDIRERKRQAGMIVREILHAKRAKKYDRKEAERDRETKEAIDRQKSGLGGPSERDDFDPTKGEKYNSGTIIDIDDKDLSELDMPEKDPPTPDNDPPTPDRDLEKEPEPAPERAGQELSKAAPSKEMNLEAARESYYRGRLDEIEKAAGSIKEHFPDLFKEGAYNSPSDVFSKARDSYASISERLSGTFMTREWFDYSSQLSKALEAKDYESFGLIHKEFTDYTKEYGRAKEIETAAQSKSAPVLTQTQSAPVQTQDAYAKVKTTIQQDLRKNLEKNSRENTLQKTADKTRTKVMAMVKKGKDVTKELGKTASKSHPAVAIVMKAVEKTAEIIRGRDMEMSRGARDFAITR